MCNCHLCQLRRQREANQPYAYEALALIVKLAAFIAALLAFGALFPNVVVGP